ncbi:MAG: hypothetical protein QXV62_07800 [Nitrososphaerota archaeon]
MAWAVPRSAMHVFDYLVERFSSLFRFHNYYRRLIGFRDVSGRYCLTHASRESV